MLEVVAGVASLSNKKGIHATPPRRQQRLFRHVHSTRLAFVMGHQREQWRSLEAMLAYDAGEHPQDGPSLKTIYIITFNDVKCSRGRSSSPHFTKHYDKFNFYLELNIKIIIIYALNK